MDIFAKTTITRGKIHKYLWMTIEYSYPGKVQFSMVNYIGNIINGILEHMSGESSTLDAHHLFLYCRICNQTVLDIIL